jgi:hypothetical protein
MNYSIWLIYQSKDPFGNLSLNYIDKDKKIEFNDIDKIEDYKWPDFKNGDYLLIHFPGQINEISDFCKEIQKWKTSIKKEVIILPISKGPRNKAARKIYYALKNNEITQEILEENKKFWENECKVVPKIKVIAKLLGLAILIDSAEAAKKRNYSRKFEEMKKEITLELEGLRNIKEKISKGPDEEWPDPLKNSLHEIINASDELFTSNAKKDARKIYKDIKNLKNKLQESSK